MPELALPDDGARDRRPGDVGRGLVPGSVLLDLDVIAGNPFAQLDRFADADQSERDGSGRPDLQPGRRLLGGRGPVRTEIAVHGLGRLEAGAGPGRVGRDRLPLDQIRRVERAVPGRESSEKIPVRRVELAGRGGGDVQNQRGVHSDRREVDGLQVGEQDDRVVRVPEPGVEAAIGQRTLSGVPDVRGAPVRHIADGRGRPRALPALHAQIPNIGPRGGDFRTHVDEHAGLQAVSEAGDSRPVERLGAWYPLNSTWYTGP